MADVSFGAAGVIVTVCLRRRRRIGVPEDATDRVPAPSASPLSGEVMAALVEVVPGFYAWSSELLPIGQSRKLVSGGIAGWN